MPANQNDNPNESFESRMKRVDTLVATLEGCPDLSLRNTAGELVATLMDLHGAAFSKTLELIHQSDEAPLLDRLAEDPLVRSVLLLHGLHPASLEVRIGQALDQVRPSLQAHRGDVELLQIAEDSVRLRLKGTCNGCPSSTSTFRNLIENAIYELAPEIQKIEVEGMSQP